MRESKTAGRKIGPVPLRKPRNTGNKVSVRASGGKKRQPHRTGSARFPAPRAVPAMTGKARTRSHRTCEKPYGGTPAAGDDGNSGPNACCSMDDIFAVDSIFSNCLLYTSRHDRLPDRERIDQRTGRGVPRAERRDRAQREQQRQEFSFHGGYRYERLRGIAARSGDSAYRCV